MDIRASCEHASSRRTPTASAGLVRLIMAAMVARARWNDPCRKSWPGRVTGATCAREPGCARMRPLSSPPPEADMRTLLLILFLAICVPVRASDLDNVVKIDSGYVLGSGTDVRVYKGI